MVIRGRKASPYSVSLGAFSYTIIENNRNGTVWVGGIPENDKYKIVKPDNYRAGYGVSINPKDLVKKIQENAKTGKAARVMAWKVGVSVQVGSVLGTNEADKIDNAIRGRSFGLQACLLPALVYLKVKVRKVLSSYQ